MLSDDPARVRLKTFKLVYQGLPNWEAYRETRGPLDFITTPDGEIICYYDLMSGFDSLAPKQRWAFTLICLLGYSQDDARDVMMPGHRASQVQDHAQAGLRRMVAAYDRKQEEHDAA